MATARWSTRTLTHPCLHPLSALCLWTSQHRARFLTPFACRGLLSGSFLPREADGDPGEVWATVTIATQSGLGFSFFCPLTRQGAALSGAALMSYSGSGGIPGLFMMGTP